MSETGPNMREVERLLRELAPHVLSAVMRRFKDFAAVEDAVQEALLAAAQDWPKRGLPERPRAWLIQVAARRMADHVRAELARRRRETFVVMQASEEDERAPAADEQVAQDDTLLLLFMCCHPALTRASAIALTLRAVGGLNTAEIANAFLVPEATMAQRISRAKQSIKSSSVAFGMPSEGERLERLGTVLHVLYLIFNEGYASSSGPALTRVDLSREAIRLTRGLHALLPSEPELGGLLALMLLTDARRDARTGPNGELISLDEQDRNLWHRPSIEEGVAILTRFLPRGTVGPYQLQAAIAAVHDEAARAEDTDWPQILALYQVLDALSDNPIVKLNSAVAAAMVHGPEHGLALIAELARDPRLGGNHRLDAVRGHLHERAGDYAQAVEHYRRAAARTASTPERNYLLEKAALIAGRVPS